MNSAPTDTINQIGALLKNCGPTKFGAAELKKNAAPPRYVWIPTEDEYEGEEPIDNATFEVSGFGSLWHRFVVNVWGTDYDTTWRMRAALFTAVHATMGRACFRIGGSEWINGGPDQKGWVCLVNIALLLPLIAQEFPANPGAEITDSGTLTTRATTVKVTTTFDD